MRQLTCLPCPDHPRCRSATWICVCGHTQDAVMCSKFHRNPFRGFGAPGGRDLPFPSTLAIDLYNSLYTSVQAVMVNRYLCCCYGLIFQCLRISLSYIQCTSWGVFNQYSEPLPHDVAVAPVEVADFSKVP